KRKDKRKRKPKSKSRRSIVKSNDTGRPRFEIKLGMIPAGYAMSACKPGEQVEIVLREFRSSEDGDLFISRLEGFPMQVLNLIRKKYKTVIWESDISNMVAIIRKDKSATVFINAPSLAKIQVKNPRPIKAGTPIDRNDISDVQEMIFKGVNIPVDVGVFVIFSAGWRRGLYYDLAPLAPDLPDRKYDINLLLGGYYSYLLFRDRFKLSERDWEDLFKSQWFPFASLSDKSINDIIAHNSYGWNVDDLLHQIKAEVVERTPDMFKFWVNIEAFKPHMKFFHEAFEQYKEDKDISCISVLYPRIEGALRTFQSLMGKPRQANQKDLADTIISDYVNPKHKVYSPLLPLKFNKYLSEYYFANFDPTIEDNPLSRNTVCHGVASEEIFCLKASTLGFLILSQLAYYFSGIGGAKEGDSK
ncbi:MAG TPA: hypothetical protein VMW64_04680, partial [Dehalococcoidia bacterium]|nr:hypothetical protein [Dehalococcoidia bacterium]